MKKGIHPKYYPDAKVTCSCGNTFTVGSTQETIRTDICSACHPFFTGEQRLVDSGGQVERFIRRLEKSEGMRAGRLEAEGVEEQVEEQVEERVEQKVEEPVSLEALDLGTRIYNSLDQAGIATVQELQERLAAGDEEMLDIKGIGPKSLAELKEKLQAEGFVPLEGKAAESSE